MTAPANESEDRTPVRLTKLSQCFPRDLSAGLRVRARENDAPARGRKPPRRMPSLYGPFGNQIRRFSYLRIC